MEMPHSLRKTMTGQPGSSPPPPSFHNIWQDAKKVLRQDSLAQVAYIGAGHKQASVITINCRQRYWFDPGNYKTAGIAYQLAHIHLSNTNSTYYYYYQTYLSKRKNRVHHWTKTRMRAYRIPATGCKTHAMTRKITDKTRQIHSINYVYI